MDTHKIKINNETYTLQYSFQAIADAEDLTGKTLLMGLDEQTIYKPKINLVCAMLWASLQTHHTISYEDCRALVNERNIGEIWQGILQAWFLSKPELQDDKGNFPQGQN